MRSISPSYLFTVCIAVRMLLAVLAKKYPMWVAPFAAIVSIGFFAVYFGGIRKSCPESGDKTGPCWWNDMRPVHGLIYAIFVIMALRKNPDAWYLLLLDVIIGIMAFGFHERAKIGGSF